MKIEGLNPNIPQPQHVKGDSKPSQAEQDAVARSKEFQQKAQKPTPEREKTVHLNTTVNREIMKDYAEYYFKQGRQLEEVKSYKQAISAYERSNMVAPDISKAKSVLNARNKEFHNQ